MLVFGVSVKVGEIIWHQPRPVSVSGRRSCDGHSLLKDNNLLGFDVAINLPVRAERPGALTEPRVLVGSHLGVVTP